ncbi:hypothetical protein [Methanosphaera sp.]|jgi:hypothetical protein|uniref:hypothetical protein n=1 Tax=Methanosphaera sp. TaxID=2666342 RepID=UPI003D92040A
MDESEFLVRLERLEGRVSLLEERYNLRLDGLDDGVDGVVGRLDGLEDSLEGWVRAVFVMVCGCILTALVSLL